MDLTENLTLHVLSLRYSSWSIRALLSLWQGGADPKIHTAELNLAHQGKASAIDDHEVYARDAAEELARRRKLGSVTGNFPVLEVEGTLIHEALAVAEWAAEQFPQAGLWPESGLLRAQARALSSEMVSGFWNLRTHLSCHPFARVPNFQPDGPTRVEIRRVLEIWEQTLSASGGPFMFGRPGIVDFMYFPVLLRFETYGIEVPAPLLPYARALHGLDIVARWRALGLKAPRVPVYDAYIEELGGDPNAAA